MLGTQFSPKSFPHGRAGVLRLARQNGGTAGVCAVCFVFCILRNNICSAHCALSALPLRLVGAPSIHL